MAQNTAMVHVTATDVVVANLTREQIDLVKNTICAGYTDTEMNLYLHQCERMALDPLARETYTFKAGGKVIIGVGIDGFRKRANDTGCYMPGSPTEYEYNGKQLVKARVYVKKLLAGEWHEFSEDAYYEEFKGSNPNWKNMARVMLSKCAEARALRRAFPRELGGLYAPEERAAIERNARPANSDPFAPPPAPIEVDAEVVEPEPERLDPRRMVWECAKDLDLTGDDVKAVIAETGAPMNSRKWTVKDVEVLCEALAARKAAPEPPAPSEHYTEARRIAESYAAAQDTLDDVARELGLGGRTDWNQEEADAWLAGVEKALGV